MPDRPKALAFDVDLASQITIRRAFPDWEVEAISGATAGSVRRGGDPGPADLLIIGARDAVAETLALCRGLRAQAGRADTPWSSCWRPGRKTG